MIHTADTKWLYRQRFLDGRLKMAFEEVSFLSRIIQDRFIGLERYRSARRIALYASFKNEVLTDSIFLHALSQGKEVFFPKVVRGRGLVFYRVEEMGELSPGSYSILEPQGGGEAEIESVDLIVVPGVVFDERGYRIGYGRGYYDRVLSGSRVVRIGLAYERQVLDEIPNHPHDVRLHLIVTERRVIRCIDMGANI